MKTHQVFILALLLVAGAIAMDSRRLDAAGWISAAAVAAVFAIANLDASPRRFASREVRTPGCATNRCATWKEQNPCVLCAGVSS
jgi:hypothetical protein